MPIAFSIAAGSVLEREICMELPARELDLGGDVLCRSIEAHLEFPALRRLGLLRSAEIAQLDALCAQRSIESGRGEQRSDVLLQRLDRNGPDIALNQR